MVSRELEKTRGILTTCDWGQGQSPKGLSQIYIFKNWSVMSKKKKKNWSIIFIVVTLLLSYISHHITHLLSYISFFWIYTTESFFKTFSLSSCACVKNILYFPKKKKCLLLLINFVPYYYISSNIFLFILLFYLSITLNLMSIFFLSIPFTFILTLLVPVFLIHLKLKRLICKKKKKEKKKI